MCHNRIKKVSDRIDELVNLKKLSFLGNNLSDLSTNIGNFKNLELLNLRFNTIKSLPLSMNNNKKLKEINLASNYITSFRNIVNENVVQLDLFENKITDIDDCIKDFTKLETLFLEKNYIKSISDNFYSLTNLVCLNVEFISCLNFLIHFMN